MINNGTLVKVLSATDETLLYMGVVVGYEPGPTYLISDEDKEKYWVHRLCVPATPEEQAVYWRKESKRHEKKLLEMMETTREIMKDVIKIEDGQKAALAISLPPKGSVGMKGAKRRRMDSIINFLEQNGPSTARQIRKDLAIPRGTVSYYLTTQEIFKQTGDGRWMVR